MVVIKGKGDKPMVQPAEASERHSRPAGSAATARRRSVTGWALLWPIGEGYVKEGREDRRGHAMFCNGGVLLLICFMRKEIMWGACCCVLLKLLGRVMVVWGYGC